MGVMSFLLAAAVAGADQGAKQYVETYVGPKEERPLLGKRGILRRVHNRGLLLNRLQEHPALVRAGTSLVFCALLAWQILLLKKRGRLVEKLGVSLMAGGGASNTLDRLARGYVVDYAAVRTPHRKLTELTFNLGDLAILAGAVLTAVGAGLGR